MALDPSNSSSLEQLALRGLICCTYQYYTAASECATVVIPDDIAEVLVLSSLYGS